MSSRSRRVGPTVRPRHGNKRFDLGAETDATVAVGFITGVNNARTAMRFFGLVACDFSGHAQRGFNGHANLQRRGRCKIESALRNVERFREMFAFISGKAHGFETNWRPYRITGQLASFRA